MSDVLIPFGSTQKRLKDMGDGTHAEVVSAEISLDGVQIAGGGLTPTESAAVQATAAALGTTADAAPANLSAVGTIPAWLRWISRGVGAPTDAAASSGTGIIGLLQALIARLPAALSSGRLAVDTGLRGGLSALGFQQITSLSTSTALTVPSGAGLAVIQAEGAAVRWRDDGTAPTATVGMLLPAGAERVFDASLAAVRLIQTASGAVVNVSYYQ